MALNLIPKPVLVEERTGEFRLSAETKIVAQPGPANLEGLLQHLQDMIRSLSGLSLDIAGSGESPTSSSILVGIADHPHLGKEGYALVVAPDQITLTANEPAGLFYGIQTLTQLLPPVAPWQISALEITDYPRFAWRGAMLDVARSFFPVEEVKQLIDLLAYYKLNRLHLHLSDDQGWRIMIKGWPKLATHGGSGSVRGGRSGYYTHRDYSEIIAYAKRRQIMIIPEIDLPGHTTAALASYPELNPDGVAPPLYNGRKVGFSSLDVHNELTYKFLTEVIGELAALTPGAYIHIGGDEALSTSKEDYALFISRLQTIVAGQNKTPIGWGEIVNAPLQPGAVVQIWQKNDDAQKAVKQGAKIIMSPAHHVYMDMKYNDQTKLGLDWAAQIEVEDAYKWDPLTVYNGVSAQDILGVEAALWTETISTIADLEYMVLPRLPGYAEIGWSPAGQQDWTHYRQRLAAQEVRWAQQDLNFYRSPQIAWEMRGD